MERDRLSIGILAGGESKRFRTDKALAKLGSKTLLEIMIEKGKALSDQVMIVVSSEIQKERLGKVIDIDSIIVDPENSPKCALTGTLTALEFSETEYTMVLPVDTPRVKIPVLRTLIDLVPGHGAVVPVWPNGYIEPLHVVYLSEHAYTCGLKLEDDKSLKMSDFLNCLTNVLYISTEVLKHQDSNLVTFTNINTERELTALEKKEVRG
jgi:molybdopterin-guanine dinucleotide biosynthesis protein A